MDRLLVVTLSAILAMSGCLDLFGRDDPDPGYAELGWDGDDLTGKDAGAWPDLDGVDLLVLDLLDWPMMPEAIDLFEDLTGADVTREVVEDPTAFLDTITGPAPEHAVVFGLDQVDLGRAVAGQAIEAYTPLLSHRVENSSARMADPWPGTPFQHRFVAIQAAPGLEVRSLFDVRENRADTIVPDPALDPVGRAFLLATIGYFGEDPSYYNWKSYWSDLLSGPVCVTLAPSYQDAYLQAFLGTNGTPTHSVSVGYTTDPAVLVENGTLDADAVPAMVLVSNQTWRQNHYSAMVAGSGQRAAAQAWQEFLLTDAFQELVFEAAAYPSVPAALPEDGFGPLAPPPEVFRPAFLAAPALGERWASWLEDFEAIRAAATCPS